MRRASSASLRLRICTRACPEGRPLPRQRRLTALGSSLTRSTTSYWPKKLKTSCSVALKGRPRRRTDEDVALAAPPAGGVVWPLPLLLSGVVVDAVSTPPAAAASRAGPEPHSKAPGKAREIGRGGCATPSAPGAVAGQGGSCACGQPAQTGGMAQAPALAAMPAAEGSHCGMPCGMPLASGCVMPGMPGHGGSHGACPWNCAASGTAWPWQGSLKAGVPQRLGVSMPRAPPVEILTSGLFLGHGLIGGMARLAAAAAAASATAISVNAWGWPS
mmetsp:Transcript_10115/g.29945  ORF Transcript_10115/g.29945 Transcript_10115/m.29945 type:complete len:274 (+) Transcript_10115:780-1601(+)